VSLRSQAPLATLGAVEQTPDDEAAVSGTGVSRSALSAIADKWLVLTVFALRSGAVRHSELLRHIDGVTQPTLTRTLRQMESAGLVTRTVFPEVPPRVEYALTERGQTLAEPVSALAGWAEANADAFRQPAQQEPDED
jgi:DNA-binding HxlR family transcriptional regulator